MGVGDWFKKVWNREEEIKEEPLRTCDRCHFDYPEASMMITDDSFFCPDCHGRYKKEKAELEFKKKQEAVRQRMRYHCYNCKFNFTRGKEFNIKLCPNCGSENFVEQDLL